MQPTKCHQCSQPVVKGATYCLKHLVAMRENRRKMFKNPIKTTYGKEGISLLAELMAARKLSRNG